MARERHDPLYLRALVDHQPSSLGAAVWRALSQTPRLLLVFFLAMIALGLVVMLHAMLDPGQLYRSGGEMNRFAYVLSIASWCTIVVIVEICIVGVREAAELPWPGTTPNTVSAVFRLLLTLFAFGFIATASIPSIFAVLIALAVGKILCGVGLRGALCSLATCRWGLRSLKFDGVITTPAKLAMLSGKLGRRAVRGRVDGNEGIAIVTDGVVARFRMGGAPLFTIDAAPQVCVLANARSDGAGYRSAGVELDDGGLPVWRFADAPDDALDKRFAQLRTRIRTGAFLDRVYLATFVLGGAGCLAYGIALHFISR